MRYRDRCPGSPPLKCGSYLGTSGIKYITHYIRVYRISLLQEAPRAYQDKCEDVSEVFDSVDRERERVKEYICVSHASLFKYLQRLPKMQFLYPDSMQLLNTVVEI